MNSLAFFYFVIVNGVHEIREKQNLKVGRIRPHGGRYCSCIISLWFHGGIYKVCSTCK